MISIAQLQDLVGGFDIRGDERSAIGRLRTLQLLQQGVRAFDRHNYSPGHVTASGIVLSRALDVVLLVHHGRLGRWLQPGGHVEAEDRDIVQTAVREILEETGVSVSPDSAELLGIHLHEIPVRGSEPAHQHFDFMWGFRTEATPTQSPAVRWQAIKGLVDVGADPSVLRAVERAAARDVSTQQGTMACRLRGSG